MNHERHLELDLVDQTTDAGINRRQFLKIAGSGIVLFFTIGELPVFAQEVRGRGPQRALPTDYNAFLTVGEDGRVACYTGKIEMGQGLVTSLAQELADELDVSIDTVDMVMGDTDLCPWDMGTFGSMSTRSFGRLFGPPVPKPEWFYWNWVRNV